MKTAEEILNKIIGPVRAELKEFIFYEDAILAIQECTSQFQSQLSEKDREIEGLKLELALATSENIPMTLEQFGVAMCKGRDVIIDHLKKKVELKDREIEGLKLELKRYDDHHAKIHVEQKFEIEEKDNELIEARNRFEQEKQKSQRLYEALIVNVDCRTMRDSAFRKKHIISSGLRSFKYVESQSIKAIQQYESTKSLFVKCTCSNEGQAENCNKNCGNGEQPQPGVF